MSHNYPVVYYYEVLDIILEQFREIGFFTRGVWEACILSHYVPTAGEQIVFIGGGSNASWRKITPAEAEQSSADHEFAYFDYGLDSYVRVTNPA